MKKYDTKSLRELKRYCYRMMSCYYTTILKDTLPKKREKIKGEILYFLEKFKDRPINGNFFRSFNKYKGLAEKIKKV